MARSLENLGFGVSTHLLSKFCSMEFVEADVEKCSVNFSGDIEERITIRAQYSMSISIQFQRRRPADIGMFHGKCFVDVRESQPQIFVRKTTRR